MIRLNQRLSHDRMIVLAVKEGGPDPATNTMLSRYIKVGFFRICHDSGGGSTSHSKGSYDSYGSTSSTHKKFGGFTVIFFESLRSRDAGVTFTPFIPWFFPKKETGGDLEDSFHCFFQKKRTGGWRFQQVVTWHRFQQAALKDNLPKDTIDRRIKAFTASSATEGRRGFCWWIYG